MKHKARRVTLVIIEACIGVSAIGGGIALLRGAMGQWLPSAFLQGTPLRDDSIPGLVLTVVIGGGMLLAAATQFPTHEWAVLFSVAMGLIMIGWEIVEGAIIDRYAHAVVPSTVVQRVLFSVLGVIIIGLSASVWMTEYRGEHATLGVIGTPNVAWKRQHICPKEVWQDVHPSGGRTFLVMISSCIRQVGRRIRRNA